MTIEGQLHLIFGDTVAVIDNNDFILAAGGDRDFDILSAGIEGVFDQLF